MATCIYCLSDGGPFNREHVIPQAFGVFEQNMVLIDGVCKACNTGYFSKHLELPLGRGSLEAMGRFKHGLKPAKEANQILNNRLSVTLEEGEFKGAILELRPSVEGRDLAIDLVPQIGFLTKRSGKREFISFWDLKRLATINKSRYDLSDKAGILFCVNGDVSEEDMSKELKRLGIKFEKRSYVPDPHSDNGKLMVSVLGKIDSVIRRAIAKIAFNYAAHQLGYDYVLRDSFNPIREYIRYGTAPRFTPVTANNDPSLAWDSRTRRQTAGHVVYVETRNRLLSLCSVVSIFNDIKYVVILAPRLSGILRRIAVGHHFNVATRKISPLIGLPISASG